MKHTKEEMLKVNKIQLDRLQEEKPLLVYNILKAMDKYAKQESTELLEACEELVENIECGKAMDIKSYKQIKEAIKKATL